MNRMEMMAGEALASTRRNPSRRWDFKPRPLKGRKGMTKRSYWVEILPGEVGYEEAAFEEAFVYLGKTTWAQK